MIFLAEGTVEGTTKNMTGQTNILKAKAGVIHTGSVRQQIMAICTTLRLNNIHQRAKTVRTLENTKNKM